MSDDRPDYKDAELTLKLYDLRREAVMRESRNAINGKFWPKSFEDIQAVAKLRHRGLRGVIVGRALYLGRFSLSEAIAAAKTGVS